MYRIIIVIAFSILIFSGCGKGDTTEDLDNGTFTLTSEAVVDGMLSISYKCEQKVNDQENSIPLKWINTPQGTGSLAIVMYHYPDPTKQDGNPNTYLYLWDIDPAITEIPYRAADEGAWFMGPNKDGTAISYTSPCSHSTGTHTYTIKIFALSETPESLPKESTLDMDFMTFLDAIGTVTTIDEAELVFDDVTE